MPEAEDTQDLSMGEQIDILMADLPAPVQRFLTSPKRDAISLALSRKYQLHADTAGVFERAYVYMLLGVYTPDEFVEKLRKGGISENAVRGLAADVNEQVFKRLREEERVGTPAPPAPTSPQVPVMEVGNREAVPPNLPGQEALPQPMPQTPLPAVVPSPIPPPPVPVYQAPPPAPASIPIYSNSDTNPSPQPVAEVYHPIARTMESDIQLIEQGYQGQQQTFVPQPVYQAPPAPVIPPPAPPKPPTPSYPPPTMAAVHLTPVDRTHANAPITKEYGSDPYREPIE